MDEERTEETSDAVEGVASRLSGVRAWEWAEPEEATVDVDVEPAPLADELSDDVALLLAGAVERGGVERRGELVDRAVRSYLRDDEQLREVAVVGAYERAGLSLGATARLAGLEPVETARLLRKHGAESGPGDG